MRFVDDSNRSPLNGDYNNVQPRFGFASALGNKMSVRGGYGIFYSAGRHTIKGEVGSAFRSGADVQFSRDGGFTRYATLQHPFPNGLTYPAGRDPLAFLGLGFDSYDPDSRNPQYQQWNFSIQREPPGKEVVEENAAGSERRWLSEAEFKQLTAFFVSGINAGKLCGLRIFRVASLQERPEYAEWTREALKKLRRT